MALLAALVFIGASLLVFSYAKTTAGVSVDIIRDSSINTDGRFWTDTAAAWVQAIGSVAAILVAVAVPVWMRVGDRRSAQTERKLRARSLALNLHPALRRLRAIVMILNDNVNKALNPPKGRGVSRETAQEALANLLFSKPVVISIPDELKQQIPELHLLGETICIAIQTALKDVGLIETSVRVLRQAENPKAFAIKRLPTLLERTSAGVKSIDIAISRVDRFDTYWK